MNAIIFLLATLIIYAGAKKLYQRFPRVYLSPLLTTPLLLVIVLLIMKIPYTHYNEGGHLLSLLLQPATIAFAIPLYKNLPTLKKHASAIVASVLCGSIVAVSTSALFAKLLHLDHNLMSSIIPRSITTPIAMNVSQAIGGVPTITAVFVIITGLIGSMIGPYLVKLFRIESEIARGILFGTAAHGTGTSKAFELSSLTGTISSISMILSALFTLASTPILALVMLP